MLPLIPLPLRARRSISACADALLQSNRDRRIDFSLPSGEPALVSPDSMSWRIFKNPIGLLIGGMAAVILELAEPAVRTGVWTHSTFRQDPVGRLRRTGMAAMVTVYGPRSLALPMIAGVVRMHGRVAGHTPAGEPFSATDPVLLEWVHATASFGFAAAYDRYVAPLTAIEFDRFYREGATTASLYGASAAPASSLDMRLLFDSMRERLEASPIVFEFLRIMRVTPQLPAPLSWVQPLLVRAAVDLVPDWIRVRLGLSPDLELRAGEAMLVRLAGAAADRIVLPDAPHVQSCRRLGLPDSYLYARRHEPVNASARRSHRAAKSGKQAATSPE